MQAVGLQTYIWNNNLRSILLLAAFPVPAVRPGLRLELVLLGGGVVRVPYDYAMGGGDPFSYAFGLICRACRWPSRSPSVWFVIAYFANQTIIDMATGARPIERQDDPELYNLLENLCISRGLKTPTLRIIEDRGPERLRQRRCTRASSPSPSPAACSTSLNQRRAGGGAGPRADPHHQPRRPHHGHRGGLRRHHQPGRPGDLARMLWFRGGGGDGAAAAP